MMHDVGVAVLLSHFTFRLAPKVGVPIRHPDSEINERAGSCPHIMCALSDKSSVFRHLMQMGGIEGVLATEINR